MLKNTPKCRIWILVFSTIFVLLKVACLVTLFDRKLQVFKNSPKWTIFGIFNELLSTENCLTFWGLGLIWKAKFWLIGYPGWALRYCRIALPGLLAMLQSFLAIIFVSLLVQSAPWHSVWKSSKMSHLTFSILAFSTDFCPYEMDMSGTTVFYCKLQLF